MHYLIAGCFLMALVNHSASNNLQVQQKPRFYSVRVGRTLSIICSTVSNSKPGNVRWFKAKTQNGKKNELTVKMMSLNLTKVNVEHSGFYYCQVDNVYGHGTELQVLRHSNRKAAARRSNMKDFIIFLQAFLLVLCIVLPLLWHYKLGKKEEAVYEEPEHDHTYEGLEIEHCGDLYEDIRAFSEVPPGPEAAWEVEPPEFDYPEIESPAQE
ncbi:B-cell antigen receptor complex-associated protein beta chain [Salminus brasiliensis]|uniref:B-cell antigen receptor complex-associated protein beta chain n=1 Tax=Salminus brasiliensis TaxID=930266 RepID=UPI003B8324A4